MTPIGRVRERSRIAGRDEAIALRDCRETVLRAAVDLADFRPSTTPGYAWQFRGDYRGRPRGGCWQDFRACEIGRICPLGRIGERIWVRETWAFGRAHYDGETGYAEEFESWRGPVPKARPPGNWSLAYAADSEDIFDHPDDRFIDRWRPSSRMPRWACRTVLTIADVRVEHEPIAGGWAWAVDVRRQPKLPTPRPPEDWP